jgi:hypothetical protein
MVAAVGRPSEEPSMEKPDVLIEPLPDSGDARGSDERD